MTVSYNPLLTPSVCFRFSTPKGCLHRYICSFVLDLLLGYSAVRPFFLKHIDWFLGLLNLEWKQQKNNSRIKPQPLTPSAKPNLLDKPHPPKAQTPKQTPAPQQKACHAQARSVGLFLWGGAPKTIRKRCWHHNFGYFCPRNVWHLCHLMGCNPINSDFKNCCLCNKQWSDGVYSKKMDYRFHGFQMHRLLALKVHGSWGLIMVQKNSFKVQIFVVSC